MFCYEWSLAQIRHAKCNIPWEPLVSGKTFEASLEHSSRLAATRHAKCSILLDTVTCQRMARDLMSLVQVRHTKCSIQFSLGQPLVSGITFAASLEHSYRLAANRYIKCRILTDTVNCQRMSRDLMSLVQVRHAKCSIPWDSH